MKLRVPERVQFKLGDVWLNLATRWPRLPNSTRLRWIRKSIRRQARRDYRNSRPPQGIELQYLFFRMTELFHVNELEKLQSGLERLFPDLRDVSYYQDFIRESAGDILGGGSVSIGTVVRKRQGPSISGMFSDPEMPRLPEEVKRVDFWLHKILPSALVVSMDVHFNERATQQLMRVQSTRYPPKVRFKSSLPVTLLGSNYTQDSAGNRMGQEVLGWLDELRSRVEVVFRPFLRGYFTREIVGKKAALPAIEVYGLKGAPEVDFAAWAAKNRNWWRSLGFELLRNAFMDEKLIFIPPQSRINKEQTPYRLIALWEPYVNSLGTEQMEMYHQDERMAITSTLEDMLLSLFRSVTILQFLNNSKRKTETLRQVVFSSLKHGFRLGKYFKLNNVIQREVMLLDRISMEYREVADEIKYELQEVTNLREISRGDRKREAGSLADMLPGQTEFIMGVVSKQLLHIRDSFSEHLTTRNMYATYVLTWVVGIATFVGLTDNWPNIKVFVQDIRQLITNIF
jgi:hypothetical protein